MKKCRRVLLATRFFVFPFAAALQTGCVSAPKNSETKLTLAHDAVATNSTLGIKKIAAGQSFGVGTQPFYLQAPGRDSVLVIPVPGSKASESITLPKSRIDDLLSRIEIENKSKLGEAQRIQSERLNKFMPLFFEAQLVLAQGKSKEALEQINKLRSEYKEITYLGFLAADLMYSLGQKSEALQLVNRSLIDFPDDARGKKLKMLIESDSKEKTPATGVLK